MYCSKCGSYLPENETVCPLCGAALKSEEPEQDLKEVSQNNVQQEQANAGQQFTQPPMAGQTPPQPPQYRQITTFYQSQTQDGSMPPVSTGEWVWSKILIAIPIVGLVMLFVWGFGSGTNLSKRNWARAQLILMLAGVIISVIVAVIVAASAAAFSSAYYY